MLLLLVGLALAAPPAQQVSITFAQVTPYCGGAAPSPEIELEARTAHPIAGASYRVHRGSKNTSREALLTAVTNGEGRLTLSLEPGQYCVVSTQRPALQATFPADVLYDNACLEREQRRCDALVTVREGEVIEPMHITHYAPCFWADPPCYLGPPRPPPPSAAPGPE